MPPEAPREKIPAEVIVDPVFAEEAGWGGGVERQASMESKPPEDGSFFICLVRCPHPCAQNSTGLASGLGEHLLIESVAENAAEQFVSDTFTVSSAVGRSADAASESWEWAVSLRGGIRKQHKRMFVPGRDRPVGIALPAGCQWHRGGGIFSFQSNGIQTITSLKPLIAQVGEGKVTVPEGAAANRFPPHLAPTAAVVPYSTVVCFWDVVGRHCASTVARSSRKKFSLSGCAEQPCRSVLGSCRGAGCRAGPWRWGGSGHGLAAGSAQGHRGRSHGGESRGSGLLGQQRGSAKGVSEDDPPRAFLEKLDSALAPSCLRSILLHAHPLIFLNNETKSVFPGHPEPMFSEPRVEYKKMLSWEKSTSDDLQITVASLAAQAFE
ncbi:PREDICTED: protein FAM220A [Bison bison bison]|uniref:Protein FAM220A n=1 Tax=Bison bison bison TaxID=43346 RepID=A0A6P3HN40_BISBB|nr:PREDICTED: protein FAM220A [Bison bison bison]